MAEKYVSVAQLLVQRQKAVEQAAKPHKMVSGTAALKQGWRLLDPDAEHLEFEDGQIRGPIQFHGMREGARDYSPLEIWHKLFPDSFLDELLNFYSSADEKFKYHTPHF